MNKPKSIHVSGRRWFQRTYGNTYHSAAIVVDGKTVHTFTRTYGYGEMYLQNAREWLKSAGYLPGIEEHENGGGEPLWRYCQRTGIVFTYECTDVARQKDLH